MPPAAAAAAARRWSRPRRLFGLAALAMLALLFSAGLRGMAARYLEPRVAGRQLAAGQRFYDALHDIATTARRSTRCAGWRWWCRSRGGTIWMLVQALAWTCRSPVFRGRAGAVRGADPSRLAERHRRARGGVRLLPARFDDRRQAIALGVAFFAVGTATALAGAPSCSCDGCATGSGGAAAHADRGSGAGTQSQPLSADTPWHERPADHPSPRPGPRLDRE